MKKLNEAEDEELIRVLNRAVLAGKLAMVCGRNKDGTWEKPKWINSDQVLVRCKHCKKLTPENPWGSLK